MLRSSLRRGLVGRVPPPPAFCRALSTSPASSDDKNKKPTRWQQLKNTWRDHGLVFVGYYATTWLGGFGVAYGGVELAGLDGVALLNYVGVDHYLDTSQLSPKLINILIAAEINELADFVRLPLVIATTPALSRRLRGTKESNPPAADK
jgi:hypothetical protein